MKSNIMLKLILGGVGFVVVLGTAIVSYHYFGKELLAFKAAESDNTINAFKEYLEEYPDGSYIDEAEEKIDAIIISKCDSKKVTIKNVWADAFGVNLDAKKGEDVLIQDSSPRFLMEIEDSNTMLGVTLQKLLEAGLATQERSNGYVMTSTREAKGKKVTIYLNKKTGRIEKLKIMQ